MPAALAARRAGVEQRSVPVGAVARGGTETRQGHCHRGPLGPASPDITLKIDAHAFREDDSKASEAINAALKGLGAS
jgi:hypothetical protein